MYARELLNEWDQRIMEFLSYVRQSGNRVSKKEVTEKMSLTRPTMIKLVTDIQSIFENQTGFELVVDNNEYHLYIAHNRTLRSVFEALLPFSRKYAILLELFETGGINVNYYCDTHQISTTTYYSEIREINSLLAEFGLKIKNNQIQGAELQIRHFFTAMFFQTLNLEKLNKLNDSLFSRTFVKELTSSFHLELDNAFTHVLSAYIYVTKKRYEQKRSEHIQLTEMMANPYDVPSQVRFLKLLGQSATIQLLDAVIRRNFSESKWLTREEQLLLVLFFMGHYSSVSNIVMFQNLRILEAQSDFCAHKIVDQFFSACNGEEVPNEQVVYSVTKAVWRHLLLRGTIEMDEEIIFNRYLGELENNHQLEEFQQVITDLFQQYPGFSYGGNEDKHLIADLGRAFNFVQKHNEKPYRIGIYYTGNHLLARDMVSYYLHGLNKLTGVSVVPWNEQECFDLIISNYDSREFLEQAEDIYLINISNPETDVQQIIEFVKHKKKAKINRKNRLK